MRHPSDRSNELKVEFMDSSGMGTYYMTFPFARANAAKLVEEASAQVALGMLMHITRRMDGRSPDALPCSAPEQIPLRTDQIETIGLGEPDDSQVEVSLKTIAEYIREGNRRMGDGTMRISQMGIARLNRLCPQMGLTAE